MLAAARGEGAEHLVAALGPAPEEPAPRAVWCGLAAEVEAWRDRHHDDEVQPDPREPGPSWLLGPRPVGAWESWRRVAHLVEDAPELLQMARSRGIGGGAGLDEPARWPEAVAESIAAVEAAHPAPAIDRSRGIERSL